MSVIFSKSCEYATQALLYLARRKEEGPVLLREISDALQIPHHFLNKIMQQLAKDGLVVSHKGANGGFVLGRAADRIRLIDIVLSVDGRSFLSGCVLGFPNCSDRSPCPVHDRWKDASEKILEMLSEKDIAELSETMDGKIDEIERLVRNVKKE